MLQSPYQEFCLQVCCWCVCVCVYGHVCVLRGCIRGPGWERWEVRNSGGVGWKSRDSRGNEIMREKQEWEGKKKDGKRRESVGSVGEGERKKNGGQVRHQMTCIRLPTLRKRRKRAWGNERTVSLHCSACKPFINYSWQVLSIYLSVCLPVHLSIYLHVLGVCASNRTVNTRDEGQGQYIVCVCVCVSVCVCVCQPPQRLSFSWTTLLSVANAGRQTCDCCCCSAEVSSVMLPELQRQPLSLNKLWSPFSLSPSHSSSRISLLLSDFTC